MQGTCYGAIKAITPDDNVILDPVPQGLYVGATGSVIVETLDKQIVTFLAVPTGAILPIAVRRVKNGSSASGIVALGF